MRPWWRLLSMLDRATNGCRDGWSGAWNARVLAGTSHPCQPLCAVAIGPLVFVSPSLRLGPNFHCAFAPLFILIVPSIPLIASHCTLTTLGSYTSFRRCLKCIFPPLEVAPCPRPVVVVGVHIGKRAPLLPCSALSRRRGRHLLM